MNKIMKGRQVMGQVISFAEHLAARNGQQDLDSYDVLECMYCETPTRPSQVRSDLSVVYRCQKPGCRKAFHFTRDGVVCRGERGRPFR